MKKTLSRDIPLSPLMIFGVVIFLGLYWVSNEMDQDPRINVDDWISVAATQRTIYCTSELLGRSYRYPIHAKFTYEFAGKRYSGQGFSLFPPSYRDEAKCNVEAEKLNVLPSAVFVSNSRPELAVIQVVQPDRSNLYWGYGFGILMFLAGVVHVIIRRQKLAPQREVA